MATNNLQNSIKKNTTLNLDHILKKLNKTSNINELRLKRQISIDKKRYEEGLAFENKNNIEKKVVDNVEKINITDNVSVLNVEIKCENNDIDLTQVKFETVNDNKIENELNTLLNINFLNTETNNKCEDDDDIIEIIDYVNNKNNPIDEIILSDNDNDDNVDDDDVIILDKDDFTDELRNKLSNLNINKIIKVEETDNIFVDDVAIKQENIEQTQNTTIMFDSVLGTISGQNDAFINELAQQLSNNLNLPVVFMSLEEFNKYKESQEVMKNEEEITNIDDSNTEVLLTSNDETDITLNENTIKTNGAIKIKGQALIQYLFGNCSDKFKNAINRDSSLHDLETHFQNLQNERKVQSKSISYYITKKKLRKLEYQRKFKKLGNFFNEIESNRNEILTHLYTDLSINENFDNDNYIIIDISLYKNFLYTCSLTGRCSVYNILNHKLINSIDVNEGASFIQPLYNDSRYYLSVIIGGGNNIDNNQTNLFVYDAILKHKRNSIDLKSQIRCLIFRYHRLYCGLSSGEIVSLNRNLNHIDKPIKVSNKKISSIGFALYDNEKLLLVGTYDGKIHILQAKTKYGSYYENKNQSLIGHKMAPLSIKCNKQFVYSCSADCHILVHCLRTRKMISEINYNSPITSLIIQNNYLLSSSADGLIRCHSLKDPNYLNLCQQYFSHYKNTRIMCMKFENNFIYYGDDKGNVESIEFNLQKCHFCKYSTCTQPFATKNYLLQHLLDYHFINNKNENIKKTTNELLIKCEWLYCNQYIEFNNLKLHLLRHL